MQAAEIAHRENPPPDAGDIAQSKGDDGSEDEDTEEEESEGEPFLAVTRERRANAGNRMSRLLELAEAEDEAQEEYADIFREQANDEEFQEAEDEGDVSLSSSDEDDEHGEQDEDQGEKELKKEERTENRKKRKRETLIQQMMKKKAAKIGFPRPPASGPAVVTESPSQPKKKSERVSWMPTAGEGSLRASSRKLAVQNKQATHARLKEKEKHRLRTVAIMKAAEQRKEASKPHSMTQADRLAEAARIERQNSKSVHRWEAAEQKKAEEQRAKLAALKNRKLEGPVIRFYSGPALWVNDKLKHVGKGGLVQDFLQGVNSLDSLDSQEVVEASVVVESPTSSAAQQPEIVAYTAGENPGMHDTVLPQTTALNYAAEIPDPGQPPPNVKMDFWQGVEYYAGLHTNDSSPPVSTITPAQPATDIGQSQSIATAIPDIPTSSPTSQPPAQELPLPPQEPIPQSQAVSQAPSPHPQAASQTRNPPPPPAPSRPPAPPPRKQLSARNLIQLLNFDLPPPNPSGGSTGTGTGTGTPRSKPASDATAPPTGKDALLRALLAAPDLRAAPAKPAPARHRASAAAAAACAVSGVAPARYRDPATGLPYADVRALKVLRRLVDGGAVWSGVLGAYVGPVAARPAKGVPEGFERGPTDAVKVEAPGGGDVVGAVGEAMDVDA